MTSFYYVTFIAILVARVYYLWSHNLLVQIVTLIASVACISVAVVYAGIAINVCTLICGYLLEGLKL